MNRASRGSSVPLLALAAVLVIGLAALGVAYGLWAETLQIAGTVETGEIETRWTTGICNEFWTWPALPRSVADYGEAEGKDVGWAEFAIDPDDPRLMTVEVHDAYPSYALDCQVEFEILGSIPVYVRGTTIEPVSPNLTGCELTGTNSKTLACDQLTVQFVDNLGTQLHPGDEAASSLRLHVEQAAESEATYAFRVGVCLAQWNEGASAAECFSTAPNW